jgi:iron(III) transport system substrate-binding protein
MWRALVLCVAVLIGCDKSDEAPVVLYTSVDEPYVKPIIERFAKETGIAVELVTDTEASKSVGLAERLRAEKDRPRCDVWWGNEPFHTVRLAEEGLFTPYEPAAAKDVRPLFKDAQHRWTGNGIRARVIAVPAWDQARLAVRYPQSLDDLLDPSLKDQILMGRPAVGTIGGHVAAIYVLRGDAGGDAFFSALRDNGVKLLGGNGPVPQQIAAGNAYVGLTDNDDVAATNANGGQLTAVLPDQAEGGAGTLAIPTTVALVRKTDNDRAKKLIDYLSSAQTEQSLIDAKFAGWSVRSAETSFHAMNIDYAAVAQSMPRAVRRATDILEGREPRG